MTLDLKNLTLRPATEADLEFLLGVYADSRSIELSLIPWPEEQKRAFIVHQYTAQTSHYREYYPKAIHNIVLCNDEPVGRSYVDRREGTIAILDLNVADKFRRKGIGTKLISDLIAEATKTDAIVTVSTEPFNPSQGLFQKLGFAITKSDESRVNLEWRPNNQASR